MYSSYYKIIKCVSFNLIHYATNLDVTSLSRVLVKLIMCFYKMYRYFESIIYSFKQKIILIWWK